MHFVRFRALGLLLGGCMLCVSCGGKSMSNRMATLEDDVRENRQSLHAMEQRVQTLEQKVDSLSGEMRVLSSRTYEVRNRASQKTGMTVYPVDAAPRAVAVSPTSVPVPVPVARPPVVGNTSLAPTPPQKQQPQPRIATPQMPPETVQVVTPAIQQPPAPPSPPALTIQKTPALPPEVAAPKPRTEKVPVLPSTAQGEEAAYKEALSLITAGRHAEGKNRFEEFLQKYPEGRYAANALYWIGESYYVQRSYPEALLEFKQVSARFPRHHKTADALLKAGMTYQKLGDKDNADLQFKALLADFPQSEAARLARSKGWGR